MISCKGAPLARAIRLTCGRWSGASPLSSRPLEELFRERGGLVAHSPVTRWGLQYSPPPEAASHRRKRLVWRSGRMDGPDRRIRGPWRHLPRAVDQAGPTRDSLLTEQCAERAATRFLPKAIRSSNQAHGTAISRGQVKQGHHAVAPDHRAVRRGTRPLPGFTFFDAAPSTLTGMELRPTLRKAQPDEGVEQGLTPAQPSSALAA